MECKKCAFYSRQHSNKCSLLKNKDVSWDCFTTKEEYKERLREMYRYYASMYKKYNTEYLDNGGSDNYTDAVNYKKYLRQVQEELNAL
jgi:stress response protein YsnF